ncbi:MAG: oligosaccharide flippase family protein [Chloroflexi bacterium]|nr:oligosaccharide flippase family protein [Chloroflexota bacterium]
MTIHKFIRGSGTATTGRILGRGIGYIAQIILARILTPDGFGLFAIGWTTLRLFAIAGHLGLDFGIIHFGSRYWGEEKSGFRSVFLLSVGGALLSGIFAGTVIYFSAPFLAITFFKKPDLTLILQGFAFTFPLATTLRVLAATSSISGKMLCGGIAEDITQPVLQIILFLAFHSLGFGLTAALLSTLISFAVAVFAAFICVARLTPVAFYPTAFSMRYAIPLFRYSIPTILAVTLAAFNLWGDRLIVGYLSTPSDTGIYQAISLITMFTTTILSGIKLVTAPTISKLFHNNEQTQLIILAKLTTRWILYITTPVLLIVALLPGELLFFVFGREYLIGKIPLLWLTLGQLFYVTFGIADQYFLMTGHQKNWLVISFVVFTVTVILDLLLIPRLGLLGAALVSSLMMLLIGLLALFIMKALLDFWLVDFHHLKPWLASIVSGMITYLVIQKLTFLSIQRVIVAICLSTSLFFFMILFLGIEKEDILVFKQILRRG